MSKSASDCEDLESASGTGKPLWLRDPKTITDQEYAALFREVSGQSQDHFTVRHFLVKEASRREMVEFHMLLFVGKGCNSQPVSLSWDGLGVMGTNLAGDELFRVHLAEAAEVHLLTAAHVRERLADSMGGDNLVILKEGRPMADDEAVSDSDSLVVKQVCAEEDPIGRIKVFSGGESPTDELELLPGWLDFLWGVVDIDLEGSCLDWAWRHHEISRRRVTRHIRKHLVAQSLIMFEAIAERPEEYEQFYERFGMDLKLGAQEEEQPALLKQLMRLICFRTSASPQELVPLQEYVDKMKEDHEVGSGSDIPCAVGRDIKSLQASPALEPYIAKGLVVIFMVDPSIDRDFAQALRRFELLHALGFHPFNAPNFKVIVDEEQDAEREGRCEPAPTPS